MSFYHCMNKIDKQLAKHLNAHCLLSPQDIDFLKQLKDDISNLAIQNCYDEQHLKALQDSIKSYIQKEPKWKDQGCLTWIYKNLLAMQLIKKYYENPLHHDDQFSSHRIAKFISHEIGLAKGLCHGFTLAMADPKLSPYLNTEITRIHVTQTIYTYQKYQYDREKDSQKFIKRRRLTRFYFCPDSAQQAEEIYQFATAHSGKMLSVGFKSHRTYVRAIQAQVEYADSNFGAYRFPSKETFKHFYIEAAKHYQKKDIRYRFYQIDELICDPENKKFIPKLFSGKIRSLLTGAKYSDGEVPVRIIGNCIYGLAGLHTTKMALVIANVPENIAYIIGFLVGLMLLFIRLMLEHKRYRGLLSLPHFIQNNWYSLKEKTTAYFSPQLQKTHHALRMPEGFQGQLNRVVPKEPSIKENSCFFSKNHSPSSSSQKNSFKRPSLNI